MFRCAFLKRVGQLIKSWENRQDSNSGQVLDNRTQTTGIATLNSRKQRLNQLQEGATKHKSYLLGDKKHIILFIRTFCFVGLFGCRLFN